LSTSIDPACTDRSDRNKKLEEELEGRTDRATDDTTTPPPQSAETLQEQINALKSAADAHATELVSIVPSSRTGLTNVYQSKLRAESSAAMSKASNYAESLEKRIVVLESAAREHTNDLNNTPSTKKRKKTHVGEVQKKLQDIMRRHLHGDAAPAESPGDSSSESDPEPAADNEPFSQSPEPSTLNQAAMGGAAAFDDEDIADLSGDQDDNDLLRLRNWLIYIDNDTRRPFTDLPSDVQKHLAKKFRSDFFAEPQEGKSASAMKNHKAFIASVTIDGCSLLVSNQRCMNMRIYHAGKDFKAPPDQACKKCWAAKRVCIRPMKVGDEYRMCLYPQKNKQGQLLGEWSEMARWTAEWA
jgi:DNA-directed RNA polymerase subunit F